MGKTTVNWDLKSARKIMSDNNGQIRIAGFEPNKVYYIVDAENSDINQLKVLRKKTPVY